MSSDAHGNLHSIMAEGKRRITSQSSLEGKRCVTSQSSMEGSQIRIGPSAKQDGRKLISQSSMEGKVMRAYHTEEGTLLDSLNISESGTGLHLVSEDGRELRSVKVSREEPKLCFIPKVCELCVKGNHAQNFCSVCKKFLCLECTGHHTRKTKTKDHILAEVTTPQRGCSECDNQNEVETYCENCEGLLCAECSEDHKTSRETYEHVIRIVKLQEDNVPVVKPKAKVCVPLTKSPHVGSASASTVSTSVNELTFLSPKKFKTLSATPGTELARLAATKPTKSPCDKPTSAPLEFPSKLTLLNKTNKDVAYFISKHVTPESFIARCKADGPVKRLSYTANAAVLGQPPAYSPQPLHRYNRSILTLCDKRHVIVSPEAIHLCDNSKVIGTQPHTKDGFKPDMIGFVNQEKFVVVCTNQRKIRYHDCETLKMLKTCDLKGAGSQDVSIYQDMASDSFILCTHTGDMLVQTGERELSQFTAEGELRRVVPVNEALFDCFAPSVTVCIDKYNNIFGVESSNGKIHVFGLEGEHQVLGQINHLVAIYSTGVDSQRNLYIIYSVPSEGHCLAKYKY